MIVRSANADFTLNFLSKFNVSLNILKHHSIKSTSYILHSYCIYNNRRIQK